MQTFIGKLNHLSKKNSTEAADIVGRVTFRYNDHELYYNFKRYSKRFTPFREDAGIRYNGKKLYGNIGMVHIRNQPYYEYATQSSLMIPKVHQAYVNLGYNIDDNWSVGTDVRFNMLTKTAGSLVYRNIKVTYTGDCVSITTKFGHDYTADPERGIRKTRTNSLSIGLKTLM